MQFILAVGYFVAEACLELARIFLPQPPTFWDYRRAPPRPFYKLDSFHDAGRKSSWLRTEATSVVKFSVDLMEKFH